MQHQTGIEHGETVCSQPQNRRTVVIADDGSAASIVVLDESQPASTGSCFEHGGRSWVIRGSRHDSRVLVAEPLTRVEQ